MYCVVQDRFSDSTSMERSVKSKINLKNLMTFDWKKKIEKKNKIVTGN